MLTVTVGAHLVEPGRTSTAADWLPLMSTPNHLTVFTPGLDSAITWPTLQARWASYVRRGERRRRAVESCSE